MKNEMEVKNKQNEIYSVTQYEIDKSETQSAQNKLSTRRQTKRNHRVLHRVGNQQKYVTSVRNVRNQGKKK